MVSENRPLYHRPVIHSAYLRVYVPEELSAPLPVHVGRHQVGRSIITSGRYGLWEESLRDDALPLEFEGRRFVCPRYPRLRMLEGLLAFHNSIPGIGSSVLVPEDIVRRAAAELDALYRDHPGARSHILTSPWHVPLRWFAAFDPGGREVVEGPDGPTIRYRSVCSRATKRLKKAVRTLTEAGFDLTVIGPVEALTEWLVEFPRDSVVELDYGTVAGLFSASELALDETASQVAASLEALRQGDMELASDHYTQAAARWVMLQARAYAN